MLGDALVVDAGWTGTWKQKSFRWMATSGLGDKLPQTGKELSRPVPAQTQFSDLMGYVA